jgi:hypothetical protein
MLLIWFSCVMSERHLLAFIGRTQEERVGSYWPFRVLEIGDVCNDRSRTYTWRGI